MHLHSDNVSDDMKFDRKTIAIFILSVALVLSLAYVAVNELSKQEYQIYLSGVRDGNAATLNNIIQQLQTDGFVQISILNNNNATATLRLVPLPVNSTK